MDITIEITNKPFEYNGNIISNRSCTVNINDKLPIPLGYPTKQEMFDGLDNKQLYFPNCLIEDFSFDEYRKYKKKAIDYVIELTELDLSSCIILKDFMIDHIQVKGNISFQSLQVLNTSFIIKRSKFERENPGNPEISFRNMREYNSVIRFQNVEFDSTSLKFSYTEMNKSKLYFENIKFFNIENDTYKYNYNLRFYGMIIDEKSQIKISDSILKNIEIDLRLSEWLGNVVIIQTEVDNSILQLWPDTIRGEFRTSYLSQQIIELVNNNKELAENKKADIFLILKQNYHKIEQYNLEDLVYVEFKRSHAKDKLEEGKKKGFSSKICAYVKYFINRSTLDITGEYGTRFGNVALTMINTVFFFSFWYYSIPSLINFEEISFSSNDIWNRLAGSIYHSMITFLTIGYGDVNPKSWCGGALSGIEGFLGLFLMAYFTIAFSRKVLR